MKKLLPLIIKYRWWLIAAPFALLIALQLYYFVQIAWWVNFNPSSTSFMREQLSVLREKNPNAQLQHRWIPYKKISGNLKRAIIASEDSNFATHEGVEWNGILRAYKTNSKKGKIVSGGSTITQQLAKNLFLSGSRSYFRKLQELAITYMLEFWMEKERIYELYLNLVEFGVGVFGCEAAARHYYGISAANLNPAQAARLAALLPKPRYFDTHRNSAYLAHRTSRILQRMRMAKTPESIKPAPAGPRKPIRRVKH
ncbi:MAG: monofunctional biosynthetic peptidoglycan transglycosylase [Oxalobacter sp.]